MKLQVRGLRDKPVVVVPTLPSEYERDRSLLQTMIDGSFGDEDFKSLAFDMGADHESLPAIGKAGKVREFVLWCERRKCLGQLSQRCMELRPKVLGWPVFHDAPITSQHELRAEVMRSK